MEKVIAGILILVGLINFYPAVGILSAEMLSSLYKIDIPSNDIHILLRHRAVLFGLLGAFIIYSAFKPELQWWAVVVGSVSMLSFVGVALLVGDYGAGIRKVVIADVIAAIGLLIVLGLRLWFVKACQLRQHRPSDQRRAEQSLQRTAGSVLVMVLSAA